MKKSNFDYNQDDFILSFIDWREIFKGRFSLHIGINPKYKFDYLLHGKLVYRLIKKCQKALIPIIKNENRKVI